MPDANAQSSSRGSCIAVGLIASHCQARVSLLDFCRDHRRWTRDRNRGSECRGHPRLCTGRAVTGCLLIEHETRYVYDSPVSTSQHLACLRPRVLPYQQVRSHTLRVEPQPTEVTERLDFFGNMIHGFQLLRPHVELRVNSTSVVEVSRHMAEVSVEASPAWESVRRMIAQPTGALVRDVAAFAYASPHVHSVARPRALREAVVPGRTLAARRRTRSDAPHSSRVHLRRQRHHASRRR